MYAIRINQPRSSSSTALLRYRLSWSLSFNLYTETSIQQSLTGVGQQEIIVKYKEIRQIE